MSVANQGALTAGERLDRLPFGKPHWRILGLIASGMFLDAMELYLAGGVLGALVKEGYSTVALNAQFISWTFFGLVIGAWSAGVLGDRFGRRFCYQLNLAIFGVASLAAAAAPNMQALIACRFVMGIGLGAEIVIGYGTLSEFVPAAVRGRAISMLALITNMAVFVAAFLGLWIIPNFGWRYMFVIVGVSAIGVWFLRKSMPESPRWLETKRRFDEADAILRKIEADAGVTTPVRQARASIPEDTVPVWIVFSRPLLKRTLIGILLNVVMGFCLYGFLGWLPTFFVKQGFSIASSLQWTTVMGLGGPIGGLIGLLVADRYGRKWTVVVSSLVAAATGAIYPTVHDPYLLMAVGFVLVTAAYVIVAVGFALWTPELYETRYRMRGAAVCGTAGRLTTAGVQFVVVALFSWGGVSGVVGLLVLLLLLQAAVFAAFAMETKQRALEEISQEDGLAVRASLAD
ncbi:MFS transporter, putative metabolite:H+ symporter [Enhydrobacter aerosaccus]|uniref:MFS transporter, putative metabolite:H+ symporter n=1 Tax=Enhydrobacter aerosaccus TaxID=225324 RepID=A0A1T4T383_9HYPH|nr:MFS transporter [Enhydrobacter aerosaccus]SKA34980.1 MFS transporter, putative metabolite:H+ symporter [Enhydrobacter aerosaccus]